ncbi:MAG: hypothetical protein ACLQCU_01775 [Acidimicrobiales bacterium]
MGILHEAGVVTGIRRGTRLELEAPTDAANELLDEPKAHLNRSRRPDDRPG